MPDNKWKCSKEVKLAFHEKHKICSKRKSGMKKKNGSSLKKFLDNDNNGIHSLEDNTMYNVCDTLNRLMNNGSISKQPSKAKNNTSLLTTSPTKEIIVVDDKDDRSTRALRRHINVHGCIKEKDLKRIKVVKVKVDNKVLKEDINYRYMRKGKHETLFDDITSVSSKYKLSYRKIDFRTKMKRIDEVSKIIIAMCIDRTEFKSQGLDYLQDNEVVANDTLNIVHGIKERLELMLKFDMNNIKHPEPSTDEPTQDDMKETIPINLNRGVNVLKETTGRGYARICKDMKKINVHLPSYYKINKQLPSKVESVSYAFNKSDLTKEKEADIKEAILGEVVVKHEHDILDFVSPDFDEYIDNDKGEKNQNVAWGAKLEGSFKDSITMLFNQHKNNMKTICEEDQLIVLSSFDGAEAIKTHKKKSSVISFSSSMLTTKLIQSKEIKAGASSNILTWLQVLGKEELPLIKAATEIYYQERNSRTEHSGLLNNSRIWYYDLHDVKMLYLLTQHSQWNRKFHPFLSCKCKARQGLANDSHSCDGMTDQEYHHLWKRSLTKWDRKHHPHDSTAYTIAQHRNWCDENNSGVTHYGITPMLLPMSSIRYDVMHMKAAVTRRFMAYVRTFMLKQSSAAIKKFTVDVIGSFWGLFHVYCWNNNLNFSKFQGSELALFVSNASSVGRFLTEEFIATEELENLCKALNLLPDIFQFLSITYISDGHENSYLSQVDIFEEKLKKLYLCGTHTFLKEDEPFYFHCLRYYMPKIARTTYNHHKLGLGIFNMQGFERRNKESKMTLTRYSSCQRSSTCLLVNNIKRLLLSFWF